MIRLVSCAVLVVLLGIAACVYADDALNINGMNIPLISGSILESTRPPGDLNAKMARYKIGNPVGEVVGYYKNFLTANDFIIVGGEQQNQGFDAAVKKEKVQFSLRIFAQGGATIYEFIW